MAGRLPSPRHTRVEEMKRIEESRPICGIYMITNLVNRKCYIGRSADIHRRWQTHRCGRDGSMAITRAFRKYGIKRFRFKIIEECSEKDLRWKEAFWISKLSPEYNGKNLETGNGVSNGLRPIRIPEHLHRRVKFEAVKRGMFIHIFVVQIITKALKK